MAWHLAHFESLLRLLRRKGCSQQDAEDRAQVAKDLVQEAMQLPLGYVRREPVANESLRCHAAHNPATEQCRYEQIVDGDRRLEEINAILATACKRSREIYIAHHSGYTYNEIADHLNISAACVKRHMSRALLIVMEYQANEEGRGHGDPGIDGPPVRVGIAAPDGQGRWGEYMIARAIKRDRKGWSRGLSACASLGK